MATAPHLLLFSTLNIIIFILISTSIAKTSHSHHPKARVLPLTKDSATSQYIAHLHQRTPLVPIKLTIDLSGQYLWIDCEDGYVSSTYKPAHCHTPHCIITDAKYCRDCYLSKLGCNLNTCSLFPNNILTLTTQVGEVAQDLVSLHSTNGFHPERIVTVRNFLFTCGHQDLLHGLPKGVKGMAGLGRSKISVPTLFSSAFRFPNKFAICLSPSSSSSSHGVMFFGDPPYVLLPGIDVSKSLVYTQLIEHPDNYTAAPIFHGRLSAEYFIGVKSIRINGEKVPIKSSLLSFGIEGAGGTKISTLNPYTVMETSIYRAVLDAFGKELQLACVPKAEAVPPFELCYEWKRLNRTSFGVEVPLIELVLQKSDVVWRINGMNSMVRVSKEVGCVGFVDGGLERTSIVIGGHQLEDNFLLFDLDNARLGFSSSLLFKQTNCSNFNFTSSI